MNPRVGVLVVTDGRAEYLARMLDSLKLDSSGLRLGPLVVVDDSGEPEHWAVVSRLVATWPSHMAPIFIRHIARAGLAEAVRSGWSAMLHTEAEYVFHVEEDFIFPEPPPLARMVDVLRIEPSLGNVVLKRQPWNPEEIANGGIIECHPDEYEDRHETGSGDEWSWVEHKRCFSLNPCVYPRHVMAYGWPDANEAGFTADMLTRGHRFAFYGARDDAPRCLHIGAKRSAAWAL